MKIGTHNGVFHADEVMAIAALQLINNDPHVIRTRDQRTLDECDIIVDVGGVYDPDNGRFDHHQRGFELCRENGIKYSSFGLVWLKYGFVIVNNMLEDCDDIIHAVVRGVDEMLVEGVDALDNGQVPTPQGGRVIPSAIISLYNKNWYESHDMNNYGHFMAAVSAAGDIIVNAIKSVYGVELAREVVREAVAEATDPRIIVMERFAPWQDTINAISNDALYMVFPAETGDTWMIQCVPPERGSFEKRKPLPGQWSGLRDGQLSAVVGIPDAVFCHVGLFICGARSKGSALHMARLAADA
jgi:uncharacterized UPF0160 family protein